MPLSCGIHAGVQNNHTLFNFPYGNVPLPEFRLASSFVAFESCAFVTVAFNKLAPELAVPSIVNLSMYFRHGFSQTTKKGENVFG